MTHALARLAISQSELFSTWPEDAIGRLVERADVLEYAPGACVHGRGDEAQYLYLVAAGSLSLLRDGVKDRPFAAGIQLPGDFQGLGPVLSETPHLYTAVAKETSVLVRVPGSLLRELVAANGRLAFSLFRALERRHLRALNRFASAALQPLRARIAELLVSIHARTSRPGAAAEIHLSQDEIAAMLGTRRQVVNRTLKTMAADGAIQLEYGRLLLQDVALLEQMAREED
ncbi:MAG TPA: Crp/Fnr family transcriptional regulator [Ramlibacter sp.]|nr:Crp/Fnr family transcriptional regulator [Ramlibacter sp.]